MRSKVWDVIAYPFPNFQMDKQYFYTTGREYRRE